MGENLMIYADMFGRCGNQMFVYAFCRKLEKLYGEGMCFNFYPLAEAGKTDKTFQNQFVCGNFESKRYFDDMRNELRMEFTPIHELSDENKILYNQIINSESVCVSFRRGDFLDKKNKTVRDVCTEDYYKKAIEKMKLIKPNAKYYFFSDDIEWVKKNCNYDVEMYFENDNCEVYEKFCHMSACKNFIMSNSTFCWWAQYISNSDDKVVISPDHWFNLQGFRQPLIDDDWLLINTR